MSCENELIEDAVNIWRRLAAMDSMKGRSDITSRAADLILLQDGDKFLSEIELTRSERALGRRIAATVGAPGTASGEVMPAGCKLAPLVFSPAYQFHLATYGASSSPPKLRHLPRTATEIERHLHQWTRNAFYLNEVFEPVAGLSVARIAAFLASIRRSHPELFLLLLSEEIELAVKLMPALDWPRAPGKVGEWRSDYFGNAKCSIAAIFSGLRLIRRTHRILAKLNADQDFSLSAIKACANQHNIARTQPAMRSLLKRTNFTVYALRKIVLMDSDRHCDTELDKDAYRFCQADSDTRTLAGYRVLDGPDSAYAKTVLDDFKLQMSVTLPVAGAPPTEWPTMSDIEVDRVGGRGGMRYGQLANYYGLSPTDLAAHAALAVARTFGSNANGAPLANLANALLTVTGYQGKGEDGAWIRAEHVNKQAKLASTVFPAKGEFGHAAGFAATSWTALEGDARLWIHLVKESQSGDPIAKMFVQLRDHLLAHTYEVRKLGRIDDAARIFCHLAQSTGLLSGDPIWLRLQERERLILGVTLKDRRPKNDRRPFGEGPKTMAALIGYLGSDGGAAPGGIPH